MHRCIPSILIKPSVAPAPPRRCAPMPGACCCSRPASPSLQRTSVADRRSRLRGRASAKPVISLRRAPLRRRCLPPRRASRGRGWGRRACGATGGARRLALVLLNVFVYGAQALSHARRGARAETPRVGAPWATPSSRRRGKSPACSSRSLACGAARRAQVRSAAAPRTRRVARSAQESRLGGSCSAQRFGRCLARRRCSGRYR